MAGRRVRDAICTLPAAGATDVRSAVTGVVPQRPAATTSTLAPVVVVRRALVTRRQDLVELAAPIDGMFLCYLPGGSDKRLVECGCQYSGRL
jgi:hypothetical protein